ncbi:hypothetical protein COL154_001062 [Colletotrichum chrysophilum]|uniref:uncharacterized protein n=1 Tax=Colletotrichum chrysophilum TaxID=1836956 RepID=UPI002301F145|nr:uncharacterized protein COL26b_008544 [Colletotrichum chrysophilum]KAJ0353560.1 hypothetical protein KNSL1_001991 [Colletotrichum chrysophilum]KAJ0370687.1 hypothetical protein COL154_001062 [Colletotrichum chrysophilum]KAJ0373300.1 hypothetical protein COL26b_008544 [Colletotrichum chrysophilum]
MSLEGSETGPIVFRPGAIHLQDFPQQAILKQCTTNIPRFLFRLTGPLSAGETSTTSVSSRAWLNNSPTRHHDLFSTPPFSPALIAHKLQDHLLSLYDFDSNLVSWTSSLLFALHYAVHRHYTGESPQDLYLLIVDTTQFPEGAFIRDLDAIDAFRGYSRIPPDKDGLQRLWRWRSGNAYFGEYLSQGRLPLDSELCDRVSLQALSEAGLRSLFPALWYRDLPATWCGAVLILRMELGSSSTGMEAEDRKICVA